MSQAIGPCPRPAALSFRSAIASSVTEMARGQTSGLLKDARLNAVFLWVRDFKGMRDFYHRTLGLPIAYENPHFAELRAEGCSIALHEEQEPHNRSDNWHLEFLVDDIEAVASALSSLGVKVDPIRTESFGRITTFRDPEDNEIGLEEPPRRGR